MDLIDITLIVHHTYLIIHSNGPIGPCYTPMQDPTNDNEDVNNDVYDYYTNEYEFKEVNEISI